jgi:hypothetical protein
MTRQLPKGTISTRGSHKQPSTGKDLATTPDLYVEEQLKEELFAPLQLGPAQVTISLEVKASDAVYWGSGVWDKIPYTVGVTSSVTLPCGATEEQVDLAQQFAGQKAWQGAQRALVQTLDSHVREVKRLYAGYFDDGGTNAGS